MHYATAAGINSRVLGTTTEVAGGLYVAGRAMAANPCAFTPVASSPCPYYFRSKTTGNWNATATWEASNDNSYWIDPPLVPSGTNALAITIQNTHTVTATADVTVDELTVNSGGIVNVNPGINLTVNDGTGTDITVVTGGTLALKSTIGGDARIGQSAGSISGNVTVEKYVPGKRAYRFISHPFSSGIALSQLTDDIDITGTGGAANGFTATQTNSPSAFWFDVSTADNATSGANTGWTAFTNTNGSGANSWDQYELLRVMVRGTVGQGLTGGSYTPSATTLDMNGTVTTGTKIITLTKGNNSTYVGCGNPFPSGVQMQNVARGSNIGANYYAWDATSGVAGAYVTNPWSMSYILPVYGAFFTTVSANTNNTLTFEEADKTSGGAALFKTTSSSNWVELAISDSSTKWDRLLINLDSNAMDVQDTMDGVKLYNPGLDFFTLSKDSVRLAVDVRPYNDGAAIPLGLTAYNRYNRYVIKTGLFDIPSYAKLYLHDKYLNKTAELKTGFEYWFDITADSNSQGNNRFEINMIGTPPSNNVVMEYTSAKMQLIPNPARDEVKISFDKLEGKSLIKLVSITGQVVYTQNVQATTGSVTIPLHQVPSGIYMVDLQSTNARFTEKLIKQ